MREHVTYGFYRKRRKQMCKGKMTMAAEKSFAQGDKYFELFRIQVN